jgi:hypothetical protein
MANHMWVCPTKKQDEFYNPEKLISLLKKEFPEYDFSTIAYPRPHLRGTTYIDVDRSGHDLFRMQCYEKFPYLDSKDSEEKNKFIEELDEMNMEDLADKMISFLENDNMDLSRCIEIRHTSSASDINLVTRWMRQYFQAVVLDEGIHPEFILPIPEGQDYKPKVDKSIIKKFGQWLNK